MTCDDANFPGWATLPLPPSLNAAYANRSLGTKGKGRFSTEAHADWVREAGWMLNAAKVRPVSGRYSIRIAVNDKMRGDIDNRCKPILDLLVKHGITPDDKFLWSLTIYRSAKVDRKTVKFRIEHISDTAASLW